MNHGILALSTFAIGGIVYLIVRGLVRKLTTSAKPVDSNRLL